MLAKLPVLSFLIFNFAYCANVTANYDEVYADHVGNGGDDYAIDFISTGFDVAEILLLYPVKGVDTKKFLEAIKKTKVNSKKELFLNNFEVDAINYPNENPPRIEISRSGWDRIEKDPKKKMRLVFHEYLGISKIDDSLYAYTQKFNESIFCSRYPGLYDKGYDKCQDKSGIDVSLELIPLLKKIKSYFKDRKIGVSISPELDTADRVRRMFKVYRSCMAAWRRHFPNCSFNDISRVVFGGKTPHNWGHTNPHFQSVRIKKASGGIRRAMTAITLYELVTVQTCFNTLVSTTDIGTKICSP